MNFVAQGRKELWRTMDRSGELIVQRWVERSGGVVDPTTGAVVGGVSEDKSLELRGFVHFPEEGGRVKTHQWDAFELCHAVVDIRPDVVIEGLADVSWEINGERYVQAERVDQKPVRQVEMCQGVEMYRTLYLRKAKG